MLSPFEVIVYGFTLCVVTIALTVTAAFVYFVYVLFKKYLDTLCGGKK
jgi:hypothetical protein